MAKHNTFDDLLNTELRWPTKGDLPFVAADDPFDNVNIPENEFTRLVFMTEGYRIAADLMVSQATDDSAKRDYLVYPIIFNYRQFIELSLKYQIAMYGPSVGLKPNWNNHDLAFLWSEFNKLLDIFGTSDPDEVDPVVREIIIEFAKIDPRSYSYRYPVDRDGNPIPVAYKDLHLATLADVMQGVAGYFSGCDGYLSSLREAI